MAVARSNFEFDIAIDALKLCLSPQLLGETCRSEDLKFVRNDQLISTVRKQTVDWWKKGYLPFSDGDGIKHKDIDVPVLGE